MQTDSLISGLLVGVLLLLPIGIKWNLDKRVVFPAAIFLGLLSYVLVLVAGLWRILPMYGIVVFQALVVVATAASLVLWRFFRDPERTPPNAAHAILSPADGRILYIKEIRSGAFPSSEKHGVKYPLKEFAGSDILPTSGHLVGIAMNWLDVHVNRAPIAGKVCLLKHMDGLFLSLRKEDGELRNERALMVIEGGRMKVGVVQIASRLVRTIIPFLKEGSDVERGQRIGLIRFGSQVDLVLPDMPDLRIAVKPGDRVKAGVSIVATVDPSVHTVAQGNETGRS